MFTRNSSDLYPNYSATEHDIIHTNLRAMGVDFDSTGWTRTMSIRNFIGQTVYVYDLMGNLLQQIPAEKLSNDPRTMGGYGLSSIPKVYVKAGDYLEYDGKSRQPSDFKYYFEKILENDDLRSMPLCIEELSIVIATERTKRMIVPYRKVGDQLVQSTAPIKSSDGTIANMLPMVVYGNFDTKQYAEMYVNINGVTLALQVVHVDFFDKGCGVVRLTPFVDGEVRTFDAKIDVSTLVSDCDGVYNLNSTVDTGDLENPTKIVAKYYLSYDHGLLETYVEKLHSGVIRERQLLEEGDNYDPRDMITKGEAAKLTAVRTEALRIENDKLSKESAVLIEENATLKKINADSDRERKRLFEKVDHYRTQDSIDEIIARKDAARERELEDREMAIKEKELHQQKTQVETVKQTVGVVGGIIGIVSLLKAPITSFFGWLFGGLAAAFA